MKNIRNFDDPEMNDRRMSIKDHFELVYLRHNYFRKSTNPSPQRLMQFEEMICNMASKIYWKNSELLKTTGIELEDVENIGRIHTVSFISMGGLYENSNLMDKFRVKHKKIYGKKSEPGERDIFLKECYNLSKFLKQRFFELVDFSRKKNRSIKGISYREGYFVGDNSAEVVDTDLWEDPQRHGFKPISKVEFDRLKRENKPTNKREFITGDNKIVKHVFIKSGYLESEDIEGTDLDPRRNSFYRSPEENILIKEHSKQIVVKRRKRDSI